MSRVFRTASVIAALALLARPASAQERNDSSFSWKGTVPAGRWLTIANISGGIHVVAATGDQVEVTATKHWRRGNPDDVRIQVMKGGSGGDVEICAIWYNGDCDEDGSHSHHRGWDRDDDVSVQFEVRIPKGVRARLTSVNGDLNIDGVGAEVDAGTVNGSISVNTVVGPVNARTTNGSIDARMTSISSAEDMSFETVNGRIEVTVPGGLDADLEMSTVNGGLDSDFPLAVSGRINPRRLRATIGKGGRRITMRTVNGGITLRKSGN
jgi:Toastrack DUF4097